MKTGFWEPSRMKTWLSSLSVIPMVNSPAGIKTISTESMGETILGGYGGAWTRSVTDQKFLWVTKLLPEVFGAYYSSSEREGKIKMRNA
jgi:hypothetical protein